MTLLLPEALVLAVVLYVTPQVRDNFLIPASGMLMSAYFMVAMVNHDVATNPYAYLQSGAFLALACAFAVSTFKSMLHKS